MQIIKNGTKHYIPGENRGNAAIPVFFSGKRSKDVIQVLLVKSRPWVNDYSYGKNSPD